MSLEQNSELNAKTAWVALRKRVEGFTDCLALSISSASLQKDSQLGASPPVGRRTQATSGRSYGE